MENFGLILAIAGAVCAAVFAGIGSAIGVGRAGNAAAGVLAEQPALFIRVLILQLLPGTQGIYGLLIAFIALGQAGVLGGTVPDFITGLSIFLSCMPIAVVGLVSAIFQGNTSIASMGALAKRPDQFGKAILFPVMVETYAIFALLISIIAVTNV